MANSFIAFPYDWAAADTISGMAGDHATFDPDVGMKDFFLHNFGRDAGANAGDFTYGFDANLDGDTAICGALLAGYNVSQLAADAPRISLVMYSDNPPTAPNIIGLAQDIPCRPIDDWDLATAPATVAEFSWFFGLTGAGSATAGADDYYNTTPTFDGTSPETLTVRTVRFRFRAVDSPDGYWEASMLILLVDGEVIQPHSSTAGVRSIEVEEEMVLDVYTGAGRRFSVEWLYLSLADKEKILAAHARAADGPIYLVPDDRVTHSTGGTIAGDFVHLATADPPARGGLVRFVDTPTFRATTGRDTSGGRLYTGKARFETWGADQ